MKVDLNIQVLAAACGAVLLAGVSHASAQEPPAPPSTAASPSAEVKASGRAGFSATWKLNEDASEKFSDKMRAAHTGARSGGGGGGYGGGGGRGGGFGGGGRGGFGGGGGRRGGGGGGGYGGGDGSDGNSAGGMREQMEKLNNPSATLTIKQDEGAFLIGDDSGHIRRLFPDGRAGKTDDGSAEVKTHWKNDELITETNPTKGPKLRETFVLAPDAKRMIVTTHFEPSWGSAFDVKRVYDVGEAP